MPPRTRLLRPFVPLIRWGVCNACGVGAIESTQPLRFKAFGRAEGVELPASVRMSACVGRTSMMLSKSVFRSRTCLRVEPCKLHQ